MKLLLNLIFIFTMSFSNIAQAQVQDLNQSLSETIQLLQEKGLLLEHQYHKDEEVLQVSIEESKIPESYIEKLKKQGADVDRKRGVVKITTKVDPENFAKFQNLSLSEINERGACSVVTASSVKRNSRGLANSVIAFMGLICLAVALTTCLFPAPNFCSDGDDKNKE